MDLRELPETERETEVQRLVTTEAQRPFDLAEGPLVRATLLRLGENEHVGLLTMHHIVSDGWSTGILIREMAVLYEAFCSGKPTTLPALPIQYADFAHWQRQWLEGEVLETQLAYWKKQLAGAPPLLELPTDHPRPTVQTFRGAHQSLTLAKNIGAGLKALSRQQGATLFMTLLAAFKILLHSYTSQDDIIVGTPIANRNRLETRGADWILRQHAGSAHRPFRRSRFSGALAPRAGSLSGGICPSGPALRKAGGGTTRNAQFEPQSALPGDVRAAECAVGHLETARLDPESAGGGQWNYSLRSHSPYCRYWA